MTTLQELMINNVEKLRLSRAMVVRNNTFNKYSNLRPPLVDAKVQKGRADSLSTKTRISVFQPAQELEGVGVWKK